MAADPLPQYVVERSLQAFSLHYWEFHAACFLVIAFLLGLGNGAVFKLVPQYFLQEAGTATGLVGAAGGLGGFFPPLVMGLFKSTLGSYALGYVLLAAVALLCLGLTMVVLGRPGKGRVTQKAALGQ
jgi:MFS transporter, NNP family, nitrate/nitrite transporter